MSNKIYFSDAIIYILYQYVVLIIWPILDTLSEMNSYTLRLLYLSIFLFILRSFEMQKIWRHQWTKIMISKIMEKKGICQKSCRTTCHVWNGYIRKLLYKVSRIKREWYPLDISSNWKGCYWGKYFYFAMAWNFFFCFILCMFRKKVDANTTAPLAML